MKYNMESLMNDLIFKEAFANKHNRKALEFLLELFLDLPKGSLRNKLEVEYESHLEKSNIKEKSVRGDIIIKYDNVTINLEAYNLCEASHNVYYEKKNIMWS